MNTPYVRNIPLLALLVVFPLVVSCVRQGETQQLPNPGTSSPEDSSGVTEKTGRATGRSSSPESGGDAAKKTDRATRRSRNAASCVRNENILITTRDSKGVIDTQSVRSQYPCR